MVYPYFDLMDIYAKHPNTVKKLRQHTKVFQNQIECGLPSITNEVLSLLSPSLSELHKSLATEIRTNTFILDAVYGKRGIHSIDHDVLIENKHGKHYRLSAYSTVISPETSCYEIETHTYRSRPDASIELSIHMLIQGNIAEYQRMIYSNMASDTHEPSALYDITYDIPLKLGNTTVELPHPFIIGWKIMPIHNHSMTDEIVENEMKQLIQALNTL